MAARAAAATAADMKVVPPAGALAPSPEGRVARKGAVSRAEDAEDAEAAVEAREVDGGTAGTESG